MEDKASKLKFFQKIFLVADTKLKVIPEMPFLKISNVDVLFGEKIFTWRIYTTNEALPTTEQVKIVNSKKFIIAALDVNNKIFVVYMAIQKWKEMPMHFKRQAQVGTLLFDKAPTKVLAKYSNYSDVFSAENAAELSENTEMNEHVIKLEEGK